jgi:hypothetical protein
LHHLYIFKNFFASIALPWLGACFKAPFPSLVPLPILSHHNKKLLEKSVLVLKWKEINEMRCEKK